MIIAIDTGGTKTLLASFSDNGKLLKSFEFKTPKSKQKYIEIIENDANLAGLFESKKFKNKHQNMLYITLSTGIGSGIITSGKINQGLKNSEIGRIPIEFDGAIKEWEEIASARAIFNVYGKYVSEISNPRQWKRIADRISRGFLVAIPIIQPDVIVIGGSLGENFEKFDLFLNQLIKENLPEGISCPKIIKAEKPREAVIYGCYEFAKEQL